MISVTRLVPQLGLVWIGLEILKVFRIRDILVWIRIRIRGSMPLTRILYPDPVFLSLTFKMPTKN
jgi:hypothetical protein